MQFHHIGIACEDIKQSIKNYEQLGYVFGEIYYDNILGVSCCFSKNLANIELVANYKSEVITPFLKRKNYIYHIAYTTDLLHKTIVALELQGYKLIKSPTPAVAFHNKKVCFLYKKHLTLIELIEE